MFACVSAGSRTFRRVHGVVRPFATRPSHRGTHGVDPGAAGGKNGTLPFFWEFQGVWPLVVKALSTQTLAALPPLFSHFSAFLSPCSPAVVPVGSKVLIKSYKIPPSLIYSKD